MVSQRIGKMKEETIQTKPVYEKPTLEVLGSFAELTLWGIDPNKWQSWADLIGGNVVGPNGIGIGS